MIGLKIIFVESIPMTDPAKQPTSDLATTLTPLIRLPIPAKFLTACFKRGGHFRALVQRYRAAADGSSIRTAVANQIATCLDDSLWILYAELQGATVSPAAAWIRLQDYAVANGIRPWTAVKAAKAGLIAHAHERFLGEWYVPISCDWRPRQYRYITKGDV
jgi:hypothetical protein